MIMVYLLLVMSAVFIRALAGYDSRYQRGKYLSIKNTAISKILLDSTSFFQKTKRAKKDQNKMSVGGACLYAALAFVVLLNIALWIAPDLPCDAWIIDTARFFLFVDTLNEKISAISILLLFASVIAWLALFAGFSCKENCSKGIRIFVWIVVGFMLLAAISSAVYFLIELIYSFL